ncbi:aspartate--tRNA ligase [Lentisphaera marina]|uniref:aspartate--tRNA ligase n=1 Tax=Lentisphaera marina TaxID=1111041 RepID=UPI002366E2CC|nr:aspartate--tRNA ligase [Lentisphaera marina]MDD7987363.1 aspartate--tRNA ligase [Lentisphaera marina]
MHTYRSHSCNDLRKDDAGQKARLSGWIHRVRDMGGIVFIDLRDHYGITQVVINPQEDFHMDVHHWKLESVITVTGEVVLRDEETFNSKIPTGEVELIAKELKMESRVEHMPFNVALEMEMPEAMRLEHRYLDLRTSRMHHNIITRAKIIAGLRQRMTGLGFNEFQTPILTASSPEGARDFLVPSRLNPGKFYALPQAPQQFKQLLMVSGFDKYFQIAPCFRDEDARADRSPGEFYQLDMEMSFATQDDVFKVIEEVIIGTFEDFTPWKSSEKEFVRIPYKESMLKYGSDKPDLRNPIIISDISPAFVDSEFTAFASVVKKGGVVRAMKVSNHAGASRKFHDKMITFAQSVGSKGLGYLIFENGELRSPIAKFLSEETINSIKDACDVQDGDVVYFVADKEKNACRICAAVRDELGQRLNLLDEKEFKFCWIVDYPMFEYNDETKQVEFSHNPFSMPQGEMEALETMDPLDVLAWQYDLVCNGIELSSGAVRNHRPDIMLKAFGIAGYSAEEVESSFSGMINAFRHGAPPHAGIAPGVDRMVMLILGEPSIREIIAFPLNGSAQDLLMNAPSPVSQDQLKELHLKLNLPKPKPKMQG